jgi:hypothetical protein
MNTMYYGWQLFIGNSNSVAVSYSNIQIAVFNTTILNENYSFAFSRNTFIKRLIIILNSCVVLKGLWEMGSSSVMLRT